MEIAEYNYITQEKYDTLRAGKIRFDDILYCLRGSLGKTAIVDFEGQGAISSSLCILRVGLSVTVKYIYYLLNSHVIKQQQLSFENGSAQPNLSATNVLNYSIPLPPFAEQRRIVSRIESLFAKLDAAKEKITAALDTFAERKAAILHKAFSGELTAKWREENGVELESWKDCTINDIAMIKGGRRLPPNCKLMNVATNHPYIRVTDFYNLSIKTDNIQYIDDKTFDKIKRYIISEKDVYISIAGTIGKVGVIPSFLNNANLTENAAKISIIDEQKCKQQFLLLLLCSDIVQQQIREFTISTSQPKLALFRIEKIKISLPTLPEQKEIVRILDSVSEKEQRAKAAAENALASIDTMKKAILVRAFRGQLGTNDPADENACELLRQVL